MTDGPDRQFGRRMMAHWALEPQTTYLDHGSFGAPLRSVLASAEAWRQRIAANPGRFFDADLYPALRAAAAELAGLLGTAGENLVFLDNATTGINAVLRSFVLMPGDEVLVTSHVHPAVRRTAEFACGRAGARLLLAELSFPIDSEAEIIQSVTAALSPRTRLLILEEVTSPTSIRLPVKAIADRCAEIGVPIMVNGAHGPGNVPVNLGDLSEAGICWYIGNCHKWLYAAHGCGFLWVHPDRQALMRPTVISARFGEGFTQTFDWSGTKDPSPWLSVSEALQFHRETGPERIRAHCHDLARKAAALLADGWGTQLGAPAALTTAMATVGLPVDMPGTREAALTLRRRLRDEHAIEVAVVALHGRLWTRISAGIYNELDDYHRLADAVLAMSGGRTKIARA